MSAGAAGCLFSFTAYTVASPARVLSPVFRRSLARRRTALKVIEENVGRPPRRSAGLSYDLSKAPSAPPRFRRSRLGGTYPRGEGFNSVATRPLPFARCRSIAKWLFGFAPRLARRHADIIQEMTLEHGKGVAFARTLNPLEKCPATAAQVRAGLRRTSSKAVCRIKASDNTASHVITSAKLRAERGPSGSARARADIFDPSSCDGFVGGERDLCRRNPPPRTNVRFRAQHQATGTARMGAKKSGPGRKRPSNVNAVEGSGKMSASRQCGRGAATQSGRTRNDRFRDGNRGKLTFAGHRSSRSIPLVALAEVRPACATSGPR